MDHRAVKLFALLGALTFSATACGDSKSAKGDPTRVAISVKAGDNSCEVSDLSIDAGRNTFQVQNVGTKTTEAEIFGEGDRVIGEVENIGPSTSRTMVVDIPAGTYDFACRPGQTGVGIRQKLVVSGTPVATQPISAELQQAVDYYRGFVVDSTAALVTTTNKFIAAVKANDINGAKAAYPSARRFYERIEPIAESFGDLDPKIDMRADDATNGKPFIGFHRLEQDLWQKNDVSQDAQIADELNANVAKLAESAKTVQITPLTMANGAKELLDEVATSKVTGEEERYSHIDLVDVEGNVEGAKNAYTQLRVVAKQKNPDLANTLDARFGALEQELERHRNGRNNEDYVLYSTLSQDDIKKLADKVDSLSEAVGQLVSVVS